MGMKVNAELPLPADLKAEYPMPEKLKEIKKERDQEIRNIFTGESDKFIVLVGPCSADNEESVCEYVNRLAKVNEKVSDLSLIHIFIKAIRMLASSDEQGKAFGIFEGGRGISNACLLYTSRGIEFHNLQSVGCLSE